MSAPRAGALLLALASTGCITTLRSPFPVKGPAHVVHVSGPSIPAWDYEGWGLLRGRALAYEFRYGWTPPSGDGVAQEIGIRVGGELASSAGPLREAAGSTAQLAVSYQVSYVFDDGKAAVALEAGLPGVFRAAAGRRFGGTTAYLQGTLAPPACSSCPDSDWNALAGVGLEQRIGKRVSLLAEAATSLTPSNMDVWDPGKGVWKRGRSGVLFEVGLRWSR